MPHSYVNLLYHVDFSTRDREPHLTAERRPRLYDYIGGVIRKRGGISLAINGVEDHVHVFANLRPDKALSDVIRDLIAGSSGWMHKVFPKAREFKWQNDYAAFTVSTSLSAKIHRYVEMQEEHHRNFSFRDEFITLLRRNGVDFDEEYLWR